MEKVAVFGGAFDPIHNGHIELCKQAVLNYGFNKVVFLPSKNPPHKTDGIPFSVKLEMLKCVESNAVFEVCKLEQESQGVNYTINNIAKLKKIYGEFTFLIGGDSMLNFDNWRKPIEIATSTPILVAGRGRINKVNSIIQKYNNLGGSIEFMPFESNISSGLVRAMVQLGEKVKGLVPEGTVSVIENYSLYINFKNIVNMVKGRLSEKLFEHTKRTIYMALKINEQVGLPFDKVFLASLLHDVAKEQKSVIYKIESDVLQTPVQHAFLGEKIAEKEFDILDADILSSIKYHTTAKANMTNIEKLIFIADMVENGRKFDGVEYLRNITLENFEKGFVEGVKISYSSLLAKGVEVYPLTKQAFDFYCKGEN